MTQHEARETLKAWKIRRRWEKHTDRLGPLPEKWAKYPALSGSPLDMASKALDVVLRAGDHPLDAPSDLYEFMNR